MRLYIAEKPSVAGDIVKAIGKRFDRKDGYYMSDQMSTSTINTRIYLLIFIYYSEVLTKMFPIY